MDITYLRRLRKTAAATGRQGILVVKFPGMVLECRILPQQAYEIEDGEDA